MNQESNPIIPAQDTTDVKLPMIQKGSRGKYVMLLQTLLMNRGYPVLKEDAEGCFGDETEKSVKAFQRDWGIIEDGVVEDVTWKYLETSFEKRHTYTVTIPGISKEMADDLLKKYIGTMTIDP